MLSRPVIMSILCPHKATSLFAPLPSSPLGSVSIFYPPISQNTVPKAVKKKQPTLAALLLWTPPLFFFTLLDSGPRQSATGATRGAAGRRGMENDKTGCPSSFPLNTDPKSILLPAWDFLQPKFWVNPISCLLDWDVVCQRWQSSPEHGRRRPAFLIRRRSISSSRRCNYH